MKKKIVLLLTMFIGILFLYVGFSSMQSKKVEKASQSEAQEFLNQPIVEDSADALENITD